MVWREWVTANKNMKPQTRCFGLPLHLRLKAFWVKMVHIAEWVYCTTAQQQLYDWTLIRFNQVKSLFTTMVVKGFSKHFFLCFEITFPPL